MKGIIEAVRDLCIATRYAGGEAGRPAAGVVKAVDWKAGLTMPEPSSRPVVDDHLETACGASGHWSGIAAEVAKAVLEERDTLRWEVDYEAYEDEPDMAALRRQFAWCQLIGPGGPLPCDRVAVGLSIQGPDILYPMHAHKAVEIYWTIGGTADWKRGLEPWERRAPGDAFVHESGVRHAMNTDAEPMLAVWAWTSALDSPVAMVRA